MTYLGLARPVDGLDNAGELMGIKGPVALSIEVGEDLVEGESLLGDDVLEVADETLGDLVDIPGRSSLHGILVVGEDPIGEDLLPAPTVAFLVGQTAPQELLAHF